MVPGTESLRVCDLIDHQRRAWKEDMVAAYFNPIEASKIMGITLSHTGREDKLVWSPSKLGQYTVRSGYHQLMEVVIDNSSLRVAGEWTKLWQARVPQKNKLLLWRALRNVLPTRQALSRKGVGCPVQCPHCGTTAENTWHAFYDCPAAVYCWVAGGLWNSMQSAVQPAEGFKETTFKLLSTLPHEKVQDFFMLFWCIWRRRNDKVWNEVDVPVASVVEMAKSYTSCWHKVRKRDASLSWHVDSSVDLIWKKPGVGRFKCNSDAALFINDGVFGVGICIRDDQGAFVLAKSQWFPGNPSPKEAEAISLLESIKLVKAAGIENVTFELDCKGVVDDVITEQSYNNELGTILNSCRELLRSLQNFEVSFIRRQANFVAHSLARASRLYASSQVFNLIPSCISGLLLNEMK